MNKACVQHQELTAYRLSLKISCLEVLHQCSQLDAIIVIVYYFFAGTLNTTHIHLPVMRDEHQGLSTMPVRNLETA